MIGLTFWHICQTDCLMCAILATVTVLTSLLAFDDSSCSLTDCWSLSPLHWIQLIVSVEVAACLIFLTVYLGQFFSLPDFCCIYWSWLQSFSNIKTSVNGHSIIRDQLINLLVEEWNNLLYICACESTLVESHDMWLYIHEFSTSVYVCMLASNKRCSVIIQTWCTVIHVCTNRE